MKKLVPLSLICLGAVGFSACSKYDDADLRGRTERLEHRVSEVETNLQSVRSLLKAQEAHAYITSFEPHSEGSGGYVITLSNGKTLKIFHGKNGQNGENGKDGVPGRDGVNGKDGINGKDGAPGRDGVSSDMQITSIEEQDNYVRFTLANGKQIELPRRVGASFAFVQEANYAVFPSQRYQIQYTTQGVTAQHSLKVIAQDGYRAKIVSKTDNGGVIELQTPSEVVDSELIVLLSDASGAVKMYAMTIHKGVLTISTESYMVEHTASTLSIPVSTNTDYEVEIPQNASWVRRETESARALEARSETLKLVIDANTTATTRSTSIHIKSKGISLRTITISQNGDSSIGIQPGESSTHNIVAGKLAETLNGELPPSLKLTGKLNSDDLAFLKNNSQTIRILDLSELDMTELPEYALAFSNFEEVKLPKAVKRIPNGLFHYAKLKHVSIPEGVTEIGTWAFADCTTLTGELRLPASLTTIEDYAFSGCKALTGTLTIPSAVTSIGIHAFLDAIGFTKLVIEGSPSIKDNAFTQLNGHTLPLEAVYSKSEEPKAINLVFWNGESYATKPNVLYIPKGTKTKYEALTGWNVFQKIEEMDVANMPK